MTAYVPNYQKKNRIFKKREKDLKHAIKNDFSREKLIKAAEKLREAKLNVFKARFSQESVLPASSYMLGEEAKLWEAISIDEIIDKYKKNKT